MGLCLTRISLPIFIPPHFYLYIGYWGDRIKARSRTAAKVWRQLCLRQNFALIYTPGDVNSHWRMWTPVRQHKPTGMKIQETLSCPSRAEYLTFWQCIGQTGGQISAFWLNREKRVGFQEISNCATTAVVRSTAEETEWTGGKEGKRNAKLLGSKLSMGNQALETSRLALSESIVLSRTHPCAGLLHTYKSSFCGSHW